MPTLIPNDEGIITPNCNVMTDYDFSNFERGRPYRWLQRICGFDFIPLRESSSSSSLENKPNEDTEYSLSYILNLFKYKQKAKRYLINQTTNLECLDVPKKDFPSCLTHTPKLELCKKTNVTITSMTYCCNVRVDKYLFEFELFVDVSNYPLTAPTIRKLTQLEPTQSTDPLSDIPAQFSSMVLFDMTVDLVKYENSFTNSSLNQIEADVNDSFVSTFNSNHLYQAVDPQNIEHFCLISHQLNRIMTLLSLFVDLQNPQSKAFNKRVLGKANLIPLHYDPKNNMFSHSKP